MDKSNMLFQDIERVADMAVEQGEFAAASVLHSLLGSLLAKPADLEMSRICANFSAEMVRQIKELTGNSV